MTRDGVFWGLVQELAAPYQGKLRMWCLVLSTGMSLVPHKAVELLCQNVIILSNLLNWFTYLQREGTTSVSQYKEIHSSLIITSIGFRSQPIDPDIPINPLTGTIPSKHGRVIDRDGQWLPGTTHSVWERLVKVWACHHPQDFTVLGGWGEEPLVRSLVTWTTSMKQQTLL